MLKNNDKKLLSSSTLWRPLGQDVCVVVGYYTRVITAELFLLTDYSSLAGTKQQ